MRLKGKVLQTEYDMKRNFFCFLFLVLLFGACRTPQNFTYFQGIENLTDEQLAKMDQKYVPRICVDDALVIYVTSPEKDNVAAFSPSPFGYYAPGENEIGILATTQNLYTYIVDEFGEINFPVLGRLHVAGMSVNETIRMLEELIWDSAPSAVISVQIVSFKVGILGEVKLPDLYKIKTTRISILELIAYAGDLTIYADRNNVWLIRDNDGKKILVKLDLTDPMIFASPYYYLQQNDMVYVFPNDAQKRNSRMNATDGTRVAIFSALITSVSVLISALLTIRGQNM